MPCHFCKLYHYLCYSFSHLISTFAFYLGQALFQADALVRRKCRTSDSMLAILVILMCSNRLLGSEINEFDIVRYKLPAGCCEYFVGAAKWGSNE